MQAVPLRAKHAPAARGLADSIHTSHRTLHAPISAFRTKTVDVGDRLENGFRLVIHSV